MVTVTPSAKGKLRDDLQREKKEEDTLIRIARSPLDQKHVGLFLDKQREGDQVILDNQGRRLLLLDRNMAHNLTGVTLDYVETGPGQGMNFTFTRT